MILKESKNRFAILVFVFQFFVLYNVSNGQTHTFVTNYGGLWWDYASAVKVSPAHDGYYIAGTTRSTSDYALLLLKIDLSGNVIFEKDYGSVGEPSEAFDLCVSRDSNLYMAGTAGGDGHPWDGLLMKTDLNGTFLWSRLFKSTSESNDYNFSMVKTKPGGVISVASISTLNGEQLLLCKHNDNGTLIFSKSLFRNSGEALRPKKVIELSDSSFLVVSNINGSLGVLLKMSRTGNVVWIKKMPGISVFDVKQLTTGEYVFFGNGNYPTQSCAYPTVFIIKTDTSGQLISSKGYFKFNNCAGFTGTSVVKTPSQGFAICGLVDVGNGSTNYNAFILKTDINGDLLWSKHYGGPLNEEAKSIENGINDNGFIIVGDTYNNTFGANDVYIVKTDSLGETFCGNGIDLYLNSYDSVFIQNCSITLSTGYTIDTAQFYHNDIFLNYAFNCYSDVYESNIAQSNLVVFPTAMEDQLYLESSDKPIRDVSIMNTLGQIMLKRSSLDEYSLTIDVSTFPEDYYFVRILLYDNTSRVFKVIKR